MKEAWTKIIGLIRKKWDGIVARPVRPALTAGQVQLLLTVSAVTVLSFLGVDIFYKLIGLSAGVVPAADSGRFAVIAPSGMPEPSAERYRVVGERNLFLTTLQAIADKSAQDGLPEGEEYTAYDLKGTIAVSDTIGYAIVEEKNQSRQKLYRLGEMIGQAKLVRVTRNAAILEAGEKEYVMKIKGVVEGSITGPSARSGAGVAVSRQEVTESLADLKSVMSQAVVRPYINGGAQQGFIISNIVPGSLYQKLGLQNGDIIMDVNNKKLTSADDILQLLNTMQAGGSVSVNLMRNGKNETINYSFH